MTCLEVITGLTLKKGQLATDNGIAYQTYETKTKGNSGIQPRWFASDFVTMYLMPTYRKMDFEHIIEVIHDSIKLLQEKKTKTSEILSKIQFLYGLIDIIKQFVKEKKPLETAVTHFTEYLKSCYPENTRLMEALAKDLYLNIVDQSEMNRYLSRINGRVLGRCYSKQMTPDEAIEFWRLDECVGNCDKKESHLKTAIIRFLLYAKNSSGVEREFKGMKRNMNVQLRPKLKVPTMFAEHFLRAVRHQSDILIDLSGDQDQTKISKKERNGFNL